MNDDDGRYALDCWTLSCPGEANPHRMIFSDHDDELGEMILEASRLIANREFQLFELGVRQRGKWRDDWYRITRFTVPEQLEAVQISDRLPAC